MDGKRLVLSLVLTSVLIAPNRAATTGVTLGVQGRSNANVSLAGQGAFVAAVWSASLNGSTDIYASVSRDGGVTFSSPVRVNSAPGDARVNGEQPPRATLVSRAGTLPALTVIWTSKREKGTAILTARSEDGGRTFSKTALVPGGEGAGNRGWESAAADAAGNTRVAWLDHREMVQAQSGDAMAGHDHPGHDASAEAKRDGAAMAQQSKLYFATIGDPSSLRVITGGVCYCCKTAIVTGPDGSVYIAWRHVYPGNLRDMAFTMSRNGGQTFSPPLRVSEDKWQLDGCPEDGPAMARASDGRLHIVWPTLVAGNAPGSGPTLGLFHTTSRDGKSFSERLRVPTEGLPHHPQLAIAADGSLALAWDELVSAKRRAVLARGSLAADGRVTFTRQILSAGDSAAYPVVAATSNGVVIAWTGGVAETSRIRVEHRTFNKEQPSTF